MCKNLDGRTRENVGAFAREFVNSYVGHASHRIATSLYIRCMSETRDSPCSARMGSRESYKRRDERARSLSEERSTVSESAREPGR